jgi:hypothetical protein
MSLCPESLTGQLPVRSARLHAGARPTVPRELGPPRPLSRRTVARASSSSKHALSCRLHDRRVCRVHALPPRLPGPEVCRVHAPRTRLPGLGVGPRPRSPRSFLRDERLREKIGSPISRSTPCRPVSQTTRRAPFMDPEAMNPFALAVARGIGRAHCTGRPYSEADLARRLPSRRNQPHARVARAMKPSPPAFGCPNASTCDLTARGSRTAGFASPPSFPGDEATRRHGALAQRNVSTIRLPERSSRSRCTGRLHVGDAVGAPVARNTGGLFLRTGCSSDGIALRRPVTRAAARAPLR